jgi:hypothetical protein
VTSIEHVLGWAWYEYSMNVVVVEVEEDEEEDEEEEVVTWRVTEARDAWSSLPVHSVSHAAIYHTGLSFIYPNMA